MCNYFLFAEKPSAGSTFSPYGALFGEARREKNGGEIRIERKDSQEEDRGAEGGRIRIKREYMFVLVISQ